MIYSAVVLKKIKNKIILPNLSKEKHKVEFLLYYMVKPEYQIHVREEIYLDNMLDLF